MALGIDGPAGASLMRENTPGTEELGMARDALRLLRRNKILFCLVLVGCSFAGLGLAMVQTPIYSASSTVLVESGGKDVVTLREVLADVPASAEALASELEVLSSREMLEQTAEHASLLNSREFNPALQSSVIVTLLAPVKARVHAWLEGTAVPAEERSPSPINDVVDTLTRHLVIAPVGRSHAIRITCTSLDPKLAATIVNVLANLYVQSHARMRDDATHDANDWIMRRIPELQEHAVQAERNVEEYRVAHGLVRGRDSLLVQQQTTEAQTELNAAQARLTQAEATLADAERAVASGNLEQLVAVTNSPAIQQLRQQQAQVTSRRADMESRLGAAHPSAIAVESQAADIQARISLEAARIVRGLRSTAAVAKANVAMMSAHYDEVRNQLDDASTLDVGLKVLEEQAEVQMKIFKTFLTRLMETDPRLNFPNLDVRILSLAVPPNHPIAPKRGMIVIGGVIFGFFAAAGAVFLINQSKAGLRTRSDVERLIGAPPIGAIPYCSRRLRPLERLLREEAVASLWARVIASSMGKAPSSILISSAVMGEGKTTLARLLGDLAAGRGERVLIIDADLRCSSLTVQISREASLPGLAEVVRGEATLLSTVLREANGAHILPAGRCDRSPVHLLSSPAFTALLRDAERTYDLVILDSPPVLIAPDAWLIGAKAAATLFVVRWGSTRAAVAATALRQLSDVGVRCIGVVFSIVDVAKLAYYDDATSISVSRRARPYYLKLAARK